MNLIVKIAFAAFTLALIYPKKVKTQPDTISVMAWNILHGGNDIADGPDKVIDIIRTLDPDVILMVETYGSGPRIAESLGYYFHLIAPEGTALDDKSINLSIFSRYPFGKRMDTDYPFYLGCREIIVHGRGIRFCSNWWHYEPWVDEPDHIGMTTDELLAWERTGKKWEMFQKVLPYFERFSGESDSVPVIIGGDMNTPSHLDWTERTQYQHNQIVFPWQTTKRMEELGYIDSYREVLPDPLQFPGITWDVKGKRDEHRIDYIFYKGQSLQAVQSTSFKAHLGEPILLSGQSIPYPSDHGIVLTKFVLK